MKENWPAGIPLSAGFLCSALRGQFHQWRFRVEPVAGGVRVVMSVRGGEPAAWVVPVRP